MAHPLQKKAQAYALLLTGNSCRYVAKETGVPLATVGRWRLEAFREYGSYIATWRAAVRKSLGGRELIEMGRRLRQLRRSEQNETKKGIH